MPTLTIGDHQVILDAEDADLFNMFPWRILPGHNGKFYAHARVSSVSYYMHRLVAHTPRGMETDHINGDGLDNRRANLRIATPSQNSANMGKPAPRAGRTHSSRFKGVSWSRERSSWYAYIQVNKRTKNLGRFSTEEEAARAYDLAAIAAWGEFAQSNGVAV